MYECNLCNYLHENKRNYIQHCKTQNHILKEEKYNLCCLCNRNYKNILSYKKHKKTFHQNDDITNNKILYKKNINKQILNKLQVQNNDLNKTIINELEIVKEKLDNNLVIVSDKLDDNKKNLEKELQIIKDNVEESKKIVNKAITKASSLIKYLMEHHSTNPPLKKITRESINTLRIDYKCEIDKNDYKLQYKLIEQYKKNIFIKNISNTILNLVNYRNPNKQSIYNTDIARNNYVIKTEKKWNEDKAGIKFTEYVIKPFLIFIREIITEFRENNIEKIKTNNFTREQHEEHIELYSSTLSLEAALQSDNLIKGIIKELAPYLRYLEQEIEELEKYDELEQLQQNIKEIIENSSVENSDDD
jgi:hypothetical protein